MLDTHNQRFFLQVLKESLRFPCKMYLCTYSKTVCMYSSQEMWNRCRNEAVLNLHQQMQVQIGTCYMEGSESYQVVVNINNM